MRPGAAVRGHNQPLLVLAGALQRDCPNIKQKGREYVSTWKDPVRLSCARLCPTKGVNATELRSLRGRRDAGLQAVKGSFHGTKKRSADILRREVESSRCEVARGQLANILDGPSLRVER
jgi:hypothetical protein